MPSKLWDVGGELKSQIFITALIYLTLTTQQTDAAQSQFMGVGSCSSSGCHGQATPSDKTRVLQNEYSTWARYDRHSKAYESLSGFQGRIIAKNLGIKDATQSEECLVCHSTYVKEDRLKARLYRIEDGVSCESCHGAAENYIESHAEKGQSYSKNLKRGLIDLSKPEVRAKVCLNCHVSHPGAELTHRLYAAGHPRLSFELDTFSEIMPKHWQTDQDYENRKAKVSSAKMWLMGQSLLAHQMIENILNHKTPKPAAALLVGPDFSLLSCYGCHHRISDKVWRFDNATKPLGQVRWNLSSAWIVFQAFQILEPSITRSITSIFGSTPAELNSKNLNSLLTFLDKTASWLKQNTISKEQWRRVFNHFIDIAKAQYPIDYEVAEQWLMAMTALQMELKIKDQTKIKELYQILQEASVFNKARFLEKISNLP